MHDLEGLSLTESVLTHQLGHEPCVKPAGHVMPSGDGAESAGVVYEALRLGESGGLGDRPRGSV
jgi:hypothetical protein